MEIGTNQKAIVQKANRAQNNTARFERLHREKNAHPGESKHSSLRLARSVVQFNPDADAGNFRKYKLHLVHWLKEPFTQARTPFKVNEA